MPEFLRIPFKATESQSGECWDNYKIRRYLQKLNVRIYNDWTKDDMVKKDGKEGAWPFVTYMDLL